MMTAFALAGPILLVEDSESDAVLVADMLTWNVDRRVDVVHARSVAEATDEVARREFMCVLLDLGLPDADGVRAVAAMRRARSSVPIVVVTGSDEYETGMQAIQAGAQDYLVKQSLDAATLWRAVRYAVERKQAEERLAHAALHDTLTGLPNRALLHDRLATALDRMQRHDGTPGLLFVDIDRFKLINDSLGHAAGDAVLTRTAQRLLDAVRAGDTVARFGGDEFVVLCEELTGEAEAVRMAERLAAATAEPLIVEGTELVISVSVGIALATATELGGDDLLRNADTALYRAKEDGRSRSTVFAEWMRAHTSERLELETSLRAAINGGELELHYQPMIGLGDGDIVAVEALVRWRHPHRGLLSPGEFIPVAEESGLIVSLGEWVLGEACRQLRCWQDDKDITSPVRVSVNLSGSHIADPRIIDTVAASIRASGVARGSLMLEITETVLMANADAAVVVLTALKDLGVGLFVDDFGTGYSSLSYLKRFPVDVLKLDRSFVAGVVDSAEDAAIATAVIALADALSLETVAEGVETKAQLDKLRDLGCSSAQGYYVAPPKPAEDVTLLLRDGFTASDTSSRAPVAVVCDDEPAIRSLYRRELEWAGAVVTEVADGAGCLALTARMSPDLIVLDVMMPGQSGLDVLRELRRRCPQAVIVLVSGALPEDVAVVGRGLGATECVQKIQFLSKVADLMAKCEHSRLVPDRAATLSRA